MTQSGSITIYTDGACIGNPGPGGWGVHLRSGNGKTKDLCGGDLQTTNNRMELTAAIKGLEALKRPLVVELHSDSRYLVDGMTQYLHSWKTKGWKKSDGKPVLNTDLWKRLDELANIHQVRWLWVPGHSGNPGNEQADALANKGIGMVFDCNEEAQR